MRSILDKPVFLCSSVVMICCLRPSTTFSHLVLLFMITILRSCQGDLGGGGGGGGWAWGPMSLVWILKRLMSVLISNASRRYRKLNENSLFLPEFYKRGIAMLCKETSKSSAITKLKFRVSNTYTSPFTIKWSAFNILRLTDRINPEGTSVYSVRTVGRSVVWLPQWSLVYPPSSTSSPLCCLH